jgi:predicted RNase H-like HicB family nuclease
MTEYTIVVEEAGTNYSASVLDFDGCIATGKTLDEVTENMRKAITFHIEGMVLYGQEIPAPINPAAIVKVQVELEGVAPFHVKS